MKSLTNNYIFLLLGTVATLIAIIILFFQWSHTYWKRRGIYNPPTTMFLGNCWKLFRRQQSYSDFTTELYNSVKNKKLQHGGFYLLHTPFYLPINPELIKSIIQTDFHYFVDRGVYINEECDPLSAHLVSLEGKAWRNLRAKLTPTFTSSRLKMMFGTLIKCSDQLITEMDKTVMQGCIDIKDILVRFTVDIIGTCAFGIDCNSLENPDTEFIQYGKLFFYENFWDRIRRFCTFVVPKLCYQFNVLAVDKKISNFFMRVLRETVEYREKSNVFRKDFLHLLLQLKNNGKLDNDENKIENSNIVRLSFNQLAAQAFIFFEAGFETSSTTMTFCLFELACNNYIQEKLREEIKAVLGKHNNNITYEAIMKMHYLHKVISETLRKYPPLPGLNRICIKDYNIPGTNTIIEKGTKLYIPVLGLHRDSQYFPDPEKFDPERFSDENKKNMHPYSYLPFGEGPRMCFGLRFALLEIKVGLTVLLKKYEFSLNEKTELPLKINDGSFIMSTEGKLWLNYKKIHY